EAPGDSAPDNPKLCMAKCTQGPFPDLRSFLREKLPEYMVPSAFVQLEALPRNASGKLDWRGLPGPGEQTPNATLVPPRDPVEVRLAKIWEDTLDVRPIGVTDNFFDLGGHSVLGATLFARIDKEFHKRLSLGTLFQAPSIEQMAALLRQEEWSS